MMVATNVEVMDVVETLNRIRHLDGCTPSSSLRDIFEAIRAASPYELIEARAVWKPDVGFVIFVPHLSYCNKKLPHRLVAYVRPSMRRRGYGKAMVREALIAQVMQPDFAGMVWHGNETSYQFWRSVGVLKE